MADTKYELPSFLEGKTSREDYRHWLQRKAQAHCRRDNKRGFPGVSQAKWKEAIHKAVLDSSGRDYYTGKRLHWELLRKYKNEDAKGKGIKYKRKFAHLPSVDHFDPSQRKPDFRICAWYVNDSKGDLTIEEFLNLCGTVLAYDRKQERSERQGGIA